MVGCGPNRKRGQSDRNQRPTCGVPPGGGTGRSQDASHGHSAVVRGRGRAGGGDAGSCHDAESTGSDGLMVGGWSGPGCRLQGRESFEARGRPPGIVVHFDQQGILTPLGWVLPRSPAPFPLLCTPSPECSDQVFMLKDPGDFFVAWPHE